MTTDVTVFINDLDGGVFAEKLSSALSDVAASVITHNKKGKLTLSFGIAQIGGSCQITVEHEIAYTKPTARGEASEKNKTQTGMYVGPKGAISLFQPDQGQMFTRNGEIIDKSTGEIK